MARTRDRTKDFREAVHTIALKQGFNEVKMEKVKESLVPRRSQQKSPFTQAAYRTLESIRTLHIFVVNHKKDYMDRYRTMEQDLNDIEHEVGVRVEACREQIEILKNSIETKERKGLIGLILTWLGVQGDVNADVIAHKHGVVGVCVKACREQIEILKNTIETKGRKGLIGLILTWLGVQGDVNADVIAHKHGVVLILSEHLQSITSLLDQLRAARFREVIDRTISRRMRRRESKLNYLETPISNDPKDIELIQQNALVGPKGIQKQLLDEETQALQVELTDVLGAVKETEKNMSAISALNNLFSTKVLDQNQQIDYLYKQAVEATENIGTGNKELIKAIKYKSSGRTFILSLLFVVVLIVTIIFLDWFQ